MMDMLPVLTLALPIAFFLPFFRCCAFR